MDKDLKQRLRDHVYNRGGYGHKDALNMMLEAADRIEELEGQGERLRTALIEARDALRDSRIGTTRMDTPEFYECIWGAADKVNDALTEYQQQDKRGFHEAGLLPPPG